MPSQGSNGKETKSSLSEQFAKDGYVYLRQAIPVNDDCLKDWSQLFTELWSVLFQRLFERGHISSPTDSYLDNGTEKRIYTLGLGIKHGFRQVVMRSPGRYELSLLNHPEWFFDEKNGKDLLEKLKVQLGPIVLPILDKDSWDDVNITNLSFVVSTPGAPSQGWHADGGHVALDVHKPCHCLNVFVPLQDMPSAEWGPTEIRPESHYYTRNLAPMLLAAKARKQLRPTVAPLLQLGDVLAFDYRVLHRGLANTTQDGLRAILVLTVSEVWFQDRLNFPKRSMYDDPANIILSKDS